MPGHLRNRQHSAKVPQESVLPGGVLVTARLAGDLQTPWRTPLGTSTTHCLRRSEQLMGSCHAPVKADRSRRLTAQLHPCIPEGSTPVTCCQYMTYLLIAPVRT